MEFGFRELSDLLIGLVQVKEYGAEPEFCSSFVGFWNLLLMVGLAGLVFGALFTLIYLKLRKKKKPKAEGDGLILTMQETQERMETKK